MYFVVAFTINDVFTLNSWDATRVILDGPAAETLEYGLGTWVCPKFTLVFREASLSKLEPHRPCQNLQ